jgi:hypothetical protein
MSGANACTATTKIGGGRIAFGCPPVAIRLWAGALTAAPFPLQANRMGPAVWLARSAAARSFAAAAAGSPRAGADRPVLRLAAARDGPEHRRAVGRWAVQRAVARPEPAARQLELQERR